MSLFKKNKKAEAEQAEPETTAPEQEVTPVPGDAPAEESAPAEEATPAQEAAPAAQPKTNDFSEDEAAAAAADFLASTDFVPEDLTGVESAEEQAKKKHRRHVIAWVSVGCAVVVLAGAAVGGGAYMLKKGGAFDESVFFSKTVLNGVDCAGMTVEQAYETLIQPDDFVVTVTGRTGDETITAEQIDLASRPDESEIQALLDNQNAHKISLLKQCFSDADYDIDMVSSYDESLAESCVDALTCLDAAQMTAPVDSSLAQNEDGTWYISASDNGTTLDASVARQAILDAIAAGDTATVDLEAMGIYQNAAVTEDDETLNRELTELQTLTRACITYDFGDQTYVCGAAEISTFLVQDANGDWSLDEQLVHDWVEQMAEATDTYGHSHSFTTTAGNTIDLPNGNFGWRINRDSTTAALVEAINAGTVETREPVYNHYGMSRSGNDIGSSYVEVDLNDQMVYLYVGGSLVLSTPCVSGLASDPERATPSNGVWCIAYKQKDATLGTYEVQGYESHVSYWMPFNGGVGLHDADGWRSSYGGSIYQYNGSHGCVNLPLSAAKTIYENVKAGWPVIVYGS